jgi:23S rRNA (adenine2030-N6)-methyltransferase
VLCEAHAEEAARLKREFSGDKAVDVRTADGYVALKALLPPPERRGLVLIDPPFERSDEFPRVAQALSGALRRFATGVYALWYPLKDEAAVAGLRAAAARIAPSVIDLELRRVDPLPAAGLQACGLIVVNPPWTFDEAMRPAMSWLACTLGGAKAQGTIRHLAGAT